MLAFVDPLSGYTVLIQSYQWGFTDAVEYVTRDFGTTPFGAWYRQAVPVQTRTLTVRFAAIDDVIDPLQTLTMLAQRHGNPIQFYPEATVGAYRLIEWPQEVPLSRVIENRLEIELVLREVGEGTAPPPITPPVETVVLAFTFNGEYPMGFCTVDGVEVPSPTPGAYIGDDWPHSMYEGGIMALDSGIFGVNGVSVSSVVRSQVWPADLSSLSGEIVGSLKSIASNRTDRFYGWRWNLSPAPDGLPEHAGVLPQPPVPTGITITAALGVPSGGSNVTPGFYEYGVLLYTNTSYPHAPGNPGGQGSVLVGPLASLTVPAPGGIYTGYSCTGTITFPNPATMSPYFSGGWYAMARKNGGLWYITWGGPQSSAAFYDGVVPYPGYPGWGGFPAGRYIGSVSVTSPFGFNVFGSGGVATPNTTGTGPWYDLTLVEFDASGALTGNTWLLWHVAGNAGSPIALAVDRTLTVAYFCRYDDVIGEDRIYKIVLSTLALSAFAVLPDHYLYTENSIRVLDSGDVLVLWTDFDDNIAVKRYSSTGTVLATYPIANGVYDGRLAHGIDDSNFWVCYTDPNVDDWADLMVNVNVATGAVLHTFITPFLMDVEPGYEGWAYTGSPFCVTRIRT